MRRSFPATGGVDGFLYVPRGVRETVVAYLQSRGFRVRDIKRIDGYSSFHLYRITLSRGRTFDVDGFAVRRRRIERGLPSGVRRELARG